MKKPFAPLMDRLRASALTHEAAVALAMRLIAWKKRGDDGNGGGLDPVSRALAIPDPRACIEHNFVRLGRLDREGRDFEIDHNLFRSFSPLALNELLVEVDRLDLADITPQEVLGLLGDLSSFRDGGMSTVPHDLAAVLVRLAGVARDRTVYVPFDTSFNIALQAGLAGAQVFAEFRNHDLGELARVVSLVLGTNIHVRVGDPIAAPQWLDGSRLAQFDLAVACPPFGLRYRDQVDADPFGRFKERTLYGEVLQARHVQAQTRGRAVLLLPHGVLFRTAAGEREFKANLIADQQLAAVVGLPPGLLNSTSIAVAALVLEGSAPAERVLMVDASGETFVEPGRVRGMARLREPDRLVALVEERKETAHSRLVAGHECAEQDYNLLPERYVVTGVRQKLDEQLAALRTVPLEDIAELIRPQALKQEDDEPVAGEFPEVAAQDLGDDDYVIAPSKRVAVAPKALAKARQQMVKPGDILLIIKGWSVGRAALVPTDLAEPWLTNQSFVIVRLKPNQHIQNPVVLLRYLASPMGQALLAGRAGGTTIPMLQTKDVRALPVAIPEAEEVERVLATDREIVAATREARRLKEVADALRRKHWSIDE